MKISYLFVLMLLFVQGRKPDTGISLYPFNNRDRWGFIDANGTIVIQPVYRAVQPFYEGLAAVRKEGYYGYIDKSGKEVIPFKYDYATFFKDGIAKVFVDGKPFYIDKAGQIQFLHHYKSIGFFNENGLAEVQTQSGHFGLINRTGELVLDTMYQSIYDFDKGFAVVYGIRHDPYAKKRRNIVYEVGLVNSEGQLTIGFGRFSGLEYFSPGIYKGTLLKRIRTAAGGQTESVFVDTAGAILFPEDEDKWRIIGNTFYQGLCAVGIPFPKTHKSTEEKNEEYIGIINTRGVLLFSDTAWTELTSYVSNRAFAQYTDSKWRLINERGQLVDTTGYDQVITYSEGLSGEKLPFVDGRSLVVQHGNHFFIDLNGKRVMDVPAIDFGYDELSQQGSYLIFQKSNNEMHVNHPPLYGYFNINTGQLVKPAFESLDQAAIGSELMRVTKEDSWGYIDQQGKMRWESVFNKADTMLDFDTENMTRGYYYAASPYREGLEGYGGWGRSANQSRQMGKRFNEPGTAINLYMDTYNPISWAGLYSGFTTYLNNTTTDTFFFEAQDSRLYIKMQAKDKNGVWRDIEYLPNSWCGNSYHQVYLAPGEFWQFKTPLYHGEFQTQLRLELTKCKRKGSLVSETIYSNTIDASINPAQFWKKGAYHWGGIMDPYLE